LSIFTANAGLAIGASPSASGTPVSGCRGIGGRVVVVVVVDVVPTVLVAVVDGRAVVVGAAVGPAAVVGDVVSAAPSLPP
jgi:hypothetical protein